MAKHEPYIAKQQVQRPTLPYEIHEAVALVKIGEDRKWAVLHLQIVDGTVSSATIVEKSIHKDLAQDAARRLVLRLK